ITFFLPSGHPDVLLVRISVFEKRGQTSGESSVPIFAVFLPPSRHAGPDPASRAPGMVHNYRVKDPNVGSQRSSG
ncbi:MAG: hypothetical protein WAZ22_10985, partial [Mesotoga infera]